MSVQAGGPTLIGEEIAGEWNAQALRDLAGARGGRYLAYCGEEGGLDGLGTLIAAENAPNARCVYEYRPAAGPYALVMGSEARGLRRRTLKRCGAVVQVPVVSLNINCLNVAAAAAVLLYYLGLDAPLPFKRSTLSSVQRNRPGVLLVGGSDHMELGSVVRSACAFGWDRVLLDDRAGAWYACDRLIKSEGRGAARRGRNPIRVAPYAEGALAAYRRMVVLSRHADGPPLHRADLVGRDTLLVLADESGDDGAWQPPTGFAGRVERAALPAVCSTQYHYRQHASVALAEAARQLGQPDGDLYIPDRRKRYRREVEAEPPADAYTLEELGAF